MPIPVPNPVVSVAPTLLRDKDSELVRVKLLNKRFLNCLIILCLTGVQIIIFLTTVTSTCGRTGEKVKQCLSEHSSSHWTHVIALAQIFIEISAVLGYMHLHMGVLTRPRRRVLQQFWLTKKRGVVRFRIRFWKGMRAIDEWRQVIMSLKGKCASKTCLDAAFSLRFDSKSDHELTLLRHQNGHRRWLRGWMTCKHHHPPPDLNKSYLWTFDKCRGIRQTFWRKTKNRIGCWTKNH